MKTGQWLGVFLIAAIALPAHAAIRILKWNDDTCSYSGNYDDAVLPTADVSLALRLIREIGSIIEIDGHDILATPPDPESRRKDERLPAADIRRLCGEEDARLSVEIKSLPKTDAVRRIRLAYLRSVCRIALAESSGWETPSELRKLDDQPKECLSFVDALENPALRKAAWERLNETMAKRNVDPGRVIERQRKRATDFGDAAMKYDLFVFGWFNCVLPKTDPDKDFEATDKALKEIIAKLKNFHKNCEEED